MCNPLQAGRNLFGDLASSVVFFSIACHSTLYLWPILGYKLVRESDFFHPVPMGQHSVALRSLLPRRIFMFHTIVTSLYQPKCRIWVLSHRKWVERARQRAFAVLTARRNAALTPRTRQVIHSIPDTRLNRTIPLILAVALFMENMDSTVIATSLPAIANDIGTSPVALKLALTSYLVSLAIFIPISGWMADRYGAKRIFRAAIGVFILGSIACALSGSLLAFVFARFAQGLGGAMMTPVAGWFWCARRRNASWSRRWPG